MRLQLTALALSISGTALALPRAGEPNVLQARHDVSGPLSLLTPSPLSSDTGIDPDARGPRRIPLEMAAETARRDLILQDSIPRLLVPQPILNVDGIGLGFLGANTQGFDTSHIPPDTQGDVGPHHYVQIVNASFAVFAKDGKALFGPVPTRTIFAGFGDPCESHDDGDGIVLYDPLADRWLISQFANVKIGAQRFHQCVAVSRTPDPTGPWARYDYTFPDYNDYPKFGVWPDGYYATYNMLPETTSNVFLGVNYCAMDRARMLNAEPAAQQCFLVKDNVSGMSPADLDGLLPPPAGEPNVAVAFGSGTLTLYGFHVDWNNFGKSFLESSLVPVAPFVAACAQSHGGSCIPQPAVGSPLLDALSDRIMYRVAYRNFGAYQSLVANHSVSANGGGGVRWYEIRDPTDKPTMYQQGTYAPDNSWRWLGSVAIDRSGGVGLGFSLAGSSVPPSVAFTAHAPSDPPGVMGQGESVAAPGGGSQGLVQRWGDYSSMSVDPADECTFWYTNEYIPADGIKNWRTRLVSFQVPGCSTAPDYSVWPTPDPEAVGRNQPAVSVTLNSAPLQASAAARRLTLAVASLPAGVSATIEPPSIAPGEKAVLALSGTGSAGLGRGQVYSVTATAADGTVATTSGTVDVVDSDFSLSPDSDQMLAAAGFSTRMRIATAELYGPPENITFSAQGVRSGVTVRFEPPQILAGQATAMVVTGAAGLPPSNAAVTVVADAASTSHRATVHIRGLSAPRAEITWPYSQQPVSGRAQVIASAVASAATSLVRIELLVDGKPIDGVFANASPAVLNWNTHVVDDGEHALAVRATDAAGGAGVSNPVNVIVQNTGDCGCSGTGGGWEALGLLGLFSLRPRRRRP